MVERVARPRCVRESFVAGRRCEVAATDSHLDELMGGVENGGGGDAGLDHDALQESTERGRNLTAREADELVGAEHGRVDCVEAG